MTGLTVAAHGAVAVVTLDRPRRRNALTAELMTEVAGLAREYRVARQWRDEAFSPDVARDRKEGVIERGRSQQPGPSGSTLAIDTGRA